ncbi:hypothetical protein [Streptomyces shaanxiensis]|uniref:Transposase n=1 Tax=Streptomyces shaanxiensis TaxID=653357 RepID=A0ABP7V8A7_9ACTN
MSPEASHKGRSQVERTTNKFKNFRATVRRYDERAYVLYGTVTVAEIRLLLRP